MRHGSSQNLKGVIRLQRLVTAESVTEGHPDKLADRISDGVLDAILATDPDARVAIETILSTGVALITGEITCQGYVDFQEIVRRTVREVGYTDSAFGIDADHCAVLIAVHDQSPDIAMGVNEALDSHSGDPFDQTGAGDQGLMFGYAVSETPELMPLPISLAHKLAARLAEVRKNSLLEYLRPDGKSQVTIAYDGDRAIEATALVVSAQHSPDIDQETLRRDLEELVIREVIPTALITHNTRIYINPTGRFVIGGPQADAGLTGRKIIVDTYGGAIPHGGGAFSGKDPTKVDRSASYYARYIAKNVVAAGLAKRCQVQLAYAIGVAQPVGMYLDTFGTSDFDEESLIQMVLKVFDPRPAAIIKQLNLKQPIYTPTSSYGHFGREAFPWEATDRAAQLHELAYSKEGLQN
ncbi:MAG: methionine adenosyltransferase [Trueperaceae bacterium]|jgi:S-adenosylmethionine synthetase|nr:methionine adenosyltransferase [Trueperaceae bacterium]|tara:strand:+ start:35615 stop:36844 length:1230 start_codon:yes stop_codon:yes gene_type:complete